MIGTNKYYRTVLACFGLIVVLLSIVRQADGATTFNPTASMETSQR